MKKQIIFGLFFLVCLTRTAIAEINVLFSPNGHCDTAIIQLANSAQTSLDAACYTFTLDTIGDALTAAHKRGVKVRVILDRQSATAQGAEHDRLLAAGIPIKVNSHHALMHHKFLVADGVSVATGSYNWTKAATFSNNENLTVFQNEPEIAAKYTVEFRRMWSDRQKFKDSKGLRGKAIKEPSAAATSKPKLRENNQVTTETVYITRTGTKYHAQGCRYLARSSIPISRADADRQGYTPCGVCNP